MNKTIAIIIFKFMKTFSLMGGKAQDLSFYSIQLLFLEEHMGEMGNIGIELFLLV